MAIPSRKSVTQLLLIGLAVWAETAQAQRCGDGQLSLSATGSLTLPASFGFQGMDVAPDGRLVLWSSKGALLLVDASRRLTTYQLPDTIVPAGVVPEGGEGFRLIDTRSGREMLAGADRSILPMGEPLVQQGERLERAIRWADGWLLGVVDLKAGQFVVRQVRASGTETLYRSPPELQGMGISRHVLTLASNRVLLLQGSAPFAVMRLDQATQRFLPLPLPLAGDSTVIAADSLKNWRSVSAVGLDCTLVLTLSDLTSDRRILVRYGADDQVERITPVDAPVGLMARIPGSQTVLAARRAGELELVWYDWRWVREPGSAGH